MGGWRRIAVPGAGVLAMVVGLLVLDWHHGRVGLGAARGGDVGVLLAAATGAEVRQSPTTTALCVGSTCREVSANSLLGTFVHWGGLLLAAAMALSLALRLRGGSPPAALARGGAILAFAVGAAAVLVLLSMSGRVPGYDGSIGAGALVTLAGVIALGFTALRELPGMTTAADGSGAATAAGGGAGGAGRGLESAGGERARPVGGRRRHRGRRGPAWRRAEGGAAGVGPRRWRPMPPGRRCGSWRRPSRSRMPGSRSSTCAARRAGQWSRIERAVARRLPPDPPFDKLTFLDLVTDRGTPVQVLPSTRVNYVALDGGQAPNGRENFRRLCRRMRARARSRARRRDRGVRRRAARRDVHRDQAVRRVRRHLPAAIRRSRRRTASSVARDRQVDLLRPGVDAAGEVYTVRKPWPRSARRRRYCGRRGGSGTIGVSRGSPSR
ncbi:MAG: hypothetical protein R2939_12935 [Kofleriaceae bacterium]